MAAANPIPESMGLGEDFYLTRRLSGKSGAMVFAADVDCRGFAGQAH